MISVSMPEDRLTILGNCWQHCVCSTALAGSTAFAALHLPAALLACICICGGNAKGMQYGSVITRVNGNYWLQNS